MIKVLFLASLFCQQGIEKAPSLGKVASPPPAKKKQEKRNTPPAPVVKILEKSRNIRNVANIKNIKTNRPIKKRKIQKPIEKVSSDNVVKVIKEKIEKVENFKKKAKRLLIIPKMDFGDVNDWYYAYIRSCFRKAKTWKADAILLEMDTPGGYGDVASKIVSLILGGELPVYVYINDNAISAGANIALAANKIFIRKGGIIGGSQPVNSKGEVHGEKYLSILRGKFRSLGELRKRPAKICEAMVDPSIVLTEKEHGISCPKGTLLTLTSDQARSLRVVEKIVQDREEVIEKIGFPEGKILVYEPSTLMRMLRFFGSNLMKDFLQFLTYLGFAIEIRTPGWGFGGGLAIASATMGFIIQMSFDKVEWFVPGIFGLGILLMGLEAFIFPGLGITGILGVLLCIGSLLFGMGMDNVPRTIGMGSVTFTICLILVSIVISVFSKIKLIRSLFSLDYQINYVIGSDLSDEKSRVMIGELGKVSIPLRPIGRVEFKSGSVEAGSVDSRFMSRGKKVRVVGFDDFKILVEEVKKG